MLRRLVMCGWFGLFAVAAAEGHSLHPDAVLRFSEILLAPNAAALIYIIEPGPNPFTQLRKQTDLNNDYNFSEEELAQLKERAAADSLDGQHFTLAGEALEWAFYRGEVYEAVGHKSGDTLRIELGYLADIPAAVPRGATIALEYEDARLEGVPGWKQIKFSPEDGVRYDGHTPYQDYEMFDLTLEEELKFTPSTAKLTLDVWLPKQSSRDSRELLAAKLENSSRFRSGFIKVKQDSSTPYWILIAMILIIALGVIAKQMGWVR